MYIHFEPHELDELHRIGNESKRIRQILGISITDLSDCLFLDERIIDSYERGIVADQLSPQFLLRVLLDTALKQICAERGLNFWNACDQAEFESLREEM